jgi:CxxC motif-containing protein
MKETKQLVCISCPMGCRLEVEMEDETILQVSGNLCSRGIVYANKELTNPTRILTSILPITGGVEEMVSVKSKTDIPKNRLFECVKSLKGLVLVAPIHVGDVIVEDLCGTGVSLVATKTVLKK